MWKLCTTWPKKPASSARLGVSAIHDPRPKSCQVPCGPKRSRLPLSPPSAPPSRGSARDGDRAVPEIVLDLLGWLGRWSRYSHPFLPSAPYGLRSQPSGGGYENTVPFAGHVRQNRKYGFIYSIVGIVDVVAHDDGSRREWEGDKSQGKPASHALLNP